MSFKDHFSVQAADYGRARPRYPPALAAFLAAQAPRRQLALDLATGNGQAALDLAEHFEQVLASDASASQLAHATRHPRIQYLRHGAERLPVRAGTVDLVAVAQAAHWFDLPRFYAEACRALHPGGIVALWTYATLCIDGPCGAVLDAFYAERVGRYWPAERRHVENGYRTLPFDLEPLPAPSFELALDWSADQLLDYVGTWSAVARCRLAEGVDPLPELARALSAEWGGAATRKVRWPVHLRLGRPAPI